MIHKYFAYKSGKYWNVNSLLPDDQIRSTLTALDWKYEVFASIQNYDEAGNIIDCPLYFDLDGEPDQVLDDARTFVGMCEFLVNVTPRIYFSGNRGFHLIINHRIVHPRCHMLVKDFALQTFRASTLDTTVYRTAAMFRIPYSIGSTLKFYKIELTRKELYDLSFADIQELARTQRIIPDQHDPSKIDQEALKEWMNQAAADLPTHVSLDPNHVDDFDMEMTPCISSMILNPTPQGARHETVFVLARYFKQCGIDYDAARNTILNQPHWRDFDNEGGEVTKVFRSVYNSPLSQRIGCRGKSSSADTMRSLCSDWCHFSPNFIEMQIIDKKGSWLWPY